MFAIAITRPCVRVGPAGVALPFPTRSPVVTLGDGRDPRARTEASLSSYSDRGRSASRPVWTGGGRDSPVWTKHPDLRAAHPRRPQSHPDCRAQAVRAVRLMMNRAGLVFTFSVLRTVWPPVWLGIGRTRLVGRERCTEPQTKRPPPPTPSFGVGSFVCLRHIVAGMASCALTDVRSAARKPNQHLV